MYSSGLGGRYNPNSPRTLALENANKMAADTPNRFSVPVETLILQLLKEQHPQLHVAPGSATYDTIVTPIALVLQPFRDHLRVIQRNQSLSNAQTMLPEELDRLVSSFLVDRRQGTKALGVQRVIFPSLQTVSIPATAVFTDDRGNRFRPLSSTQVTINSLANSTLSETGEYYVDVSVIAEKAGDDSAALAGAVTAFTGIAGAARTYNAADYFQGSAGESNSQLVARVKKSLANRELVKKTAISSLLLETFPSVRDVLVHGYGDSLMSRDTVDVVLASHKLFEQSFAQKVNLPLDANGEVQWTTDAGAAITAPIGGFVGAVYDLTGKDFNALSITLDGQVYEVVSAQPGNILRFLDLDDADAVANDYRITRVEEVAVAPGGTPVKVLRLDRPLTDTTEVDVSTALDTVPYTVIGRFNTSRFHVGGKVDVYVDSTADITQKVVVSSLPPLNSQTLDVAEIPLTQSFINAAGNNLFEGNVGFQAPVIAITKVEQIDPSNDQVVVRVLVPDTHYIQVTAASRGRFTKTTNDVLVIRGTEVDPSTATTLPLFVGQRIRVTYVTNPDVPLIQEFVNADNQRDLTKDIQILTPSIVIFNVDLEYVGNLPALEVQTIIKEYISSKSFGAAVSVNELVTILAFFGVVDVRMPMRLRSRQDTGGGSFTFDESDDRLSIGSASVFVPDEQLNITKLG